MLRDLVTAPQAFNADEIHGLRVGVLSSRFMGRSTLGGTFRATRGFALTFRREAFADVVERFAFLRCYVDRALDSSRFLHSSQAAPNAFYLNALGVPPGARVGPHVDATLSKKDAETETVPLWVSVAYLSVPKLRGGHLLLSERGTLLHDVAPVEGDLLWFRGDLLHEVTTVEVEDDNTPTQQTEEARIAGGRASGYGGAAEDHRPSDNDERLRWSLVCEQYALDDEALAEVPRLRVHSKAGFAAYLDDVRARGVTGQATQMVSAPDRNK